MEDKSLDEKVQTLSEKPLLPTTEQPVPPNPALHPAVYVSAWLTLSSSIILFNKYILSTAGFAYPIILTCWHLFFATICTQLMARFTHMLDSRKRIPMTPRTYVRKIVPIGVMFSTSLIFGNQAYLYLSVSFIQMLKATMPLATLITGWVFRISPMSLSKLGNVSIIVMGIMIASIGEIQFVLIGFFYQCGAILAEAVRYVIVEQLLSGAGSEYKMDPLVSLYYFAPICAIMNGIIAWFVEVPRITLAEVQHVGLFVLLLNAGVAFLLNVSSVTLIGKTSSLVMCLCGILKDPLLVCASMLIFRDPVTRLQVFGYSIAICGLLYYKLGNERLRGLLDSCRNVYATKPSALS